ncbi:MAG: discoidin domain-containing protein [Lentisphaerales bacterium]|nr:discoidin domain-containing protein [Lentisphaerales bacterium]
MNRLSLFAAGLLAFTVNAADKMVDLEIEYPEKLVKGTEVPKNIPNLEKPRAKDTDPVLIKVPGGCENLAEEKEVTGSDEDPSIGDLDYLVDGDADGNEYVQFKEGLQWVQIDLEESKTLYAAHIWHYHAQPRVYNDIVIQVSDDPDFIDGVKTVFNNDHDNSSGLGKGTDKNYIEEFYGKSFPIKAVKGQYIRFYSQGNSADKSNHYIEIQVYGR